jgi:hypothetical protein
VSSSPGEHTPAARDPLERQRVHDRLGGGAVDEAKRNRHRRERAPVVDGRAESRQGGAMFGHAVALVLLEAVAGMRGAEARHQPVARDLGDDRRRRDRGDQPVAADHRLAVAAAVDAVAAVDEHEARPDRQRRHRARQRPQRGAQDVVAVDARRRRHRHRDLGARADALVQHFAPLSRQLFGIVEPTRHVVRIEDDGGGNDRAGERPPARFVTAGNRPHAALERRALAAERRARLFLAKRQARRFLFLARDSVAADLIATHAVHDDHATARAAMSNGVPEDYGENATGSAASRTTDINGPRDIYEIPLTAVSDCGKIVGCVVERIGKHAVGA